MARFDFWQAFERRREELRSLSGRVYSGLRDENLGTPEDRMDAVVTQARIARNVARMRREVGI